MMEEMIITINGSTYRLAGSTAAPVSADVNGEILLRLDKIDTRLDAVETRLDNVEAEQKAMRKDFTEFKAEVGARFDAQGMQFTMMRSEISGLQTSVYWVLAAIGIFIAGLAIPALVISLAGMFNSRDLKPKGSELEETIRRVVREMMPELKS